MSYSTLFCLHRGGNINDAIRNVGYIRLTKQHNKFEAFGICSKIGSVLMFTARFAM